MADFTWLPANQAATEDVEVLFATSGAAKCRCQALKVPGWIWRDTTQEQRDRARCSSRPPVAPPDRRPG
jgi:hypothetical protein